MRTQRALNAGARSDERFHDVQLPDHRGVLLSEPGSVWWAQIDERCPVVFLSSPSADVVRAILVVAPAQRTIDRLIEIPISALEGLPFDGVVRIAFPEPGFVPCNWLVTLSRQRLLERMGSLSPEKLRRLDDALRRAELE